jgi:DNA-binding transcriptional ArsR family regulator
MSDDVIIWTALADSKRRQIVNLLEEKPRTTSELSKFFDVSRFAVMKHLKVLEQANLIRVKREGRKRWNILNDDLAHFLRTKLADDDGPYRLVEILGLFPGHKPATPMANGAADPIHIKQTVLLQASPSQVFEALTVGIDAWWSWRVSAGSKVYLEPIVNGRFYEAFNTDGQGIFYANVTYIKQDEEIRLRGPLELSEQAANMPVPDSYIGIVLEAQDNGTMLSLSHHISSGVDDTTGDVCKQRWHTILNQDLKLFVEKGIPYQCRQEQE